MKVPFETQHVQNIHFFNSKIMCMCVQKLIQQRVVDKKWQLQKNVPPGELTPEKSQNFLVRN
jgi:hypothetical protein